MKLKVPYEIMQVENQSYAVPVDESGDGFKGMVKLSRTAAVIFEMLQEETNEEAIVNRLGQSFDAPKDVLAADVHEIVEKLREKGLLI